MPKDRLSDLESEHQKLKAQYRDIEARYKDALFRLKSQDAIPVHSIAGLDQKVIQTDWDLNITYVNTAMASVIVMDRKELKGQHLAKIDNFNWGPGYLQVLVFQCRNLEEEIIRERTYFDRSKGQEMAIRITVSRISSGYQIVLEDRTEFLALEKRFAKYVSPKVLDLMKEEGRDFDMPRRYELSILFADLRGFTAMSEKMDPEDVRETLNYYLVNMISIVESNDAMVDKIIGDEIMVLCGAPLRREDHALQAVKVGLEMLEVHKTLREIWEKEGKFMPEVGIGINSGEAVVGSIGTERRSDFTVLGYSVNLASRLCDVAEPGTIYISEITRKAITDTAPEILSKVNITKQDALSVRGINKPVDVYRLTSSLEAVKKIKVKEIDVKTKSIKEKEKRLFGRYQLLEEIGRGGMGIVYRALHAEMGRILALKILQGGDLVRERQVRMFHREIEAMAKLSHASIINIHDVGTVNNERYFTMDFIDGCTLDELMTGLGKTADKGTASTFREVIEQVQKQKSVVNVEEEPDKTSAPGPEAQQTEVSVSATGDVVERKVRVGRFRALNEGQALNIMMKTLRALEHAHARGVIHRDIKPSNIMITKDSEPVIMDFGLARQLDARESMMLTQAGQVMGTPAYMSPEQAEGKKDEVKERSDIYSIGAVFYEMLTGRPPFISKGNAIEDIKAVSEEEPPAVRKLNPFVSKDLETMCQKAMEKDQERRYRTAGAFGDDLQRYIDGDPIQARPQGIFYKIKKKIMKYKALAASFSIIVLILLGVMAYWYQSKATLKEKEEALIEERAKAEGRWHLVYENDFNNQILDSANWYFRNPDMNTLEYGVETGMMFLRKRGYLYSNIKVPGNIKLEYDAIIYGFNEISGRIKVDTTYGENGKYYYYCWMDWSIKWRKSPWKEPLFFKEEIIEDLTKLGRKRLHIEITYEDGLCTYKVDGKVKCQTRDLFTFNEMEHNIWGFRSILDTLYIDNLKVYKQMLPQRVDIVKFADVYIEKKQYKEAFDYLRSILQFYNEKDVLERTVIRMVAMEDLAPGVRAFKSILSSKEILSKLYRVAGTDLLRRLLEKGFYSIARDRTFKDYEPAIEVYSQDMLDEEKFEFHVYLALLFHSYNNLASARNHFIRALAFKKDDVIVQYASTGVMLRQIGTKGSMKRIPAGYLPKRFGECMYIKSFYMDSTELTQTDYIKVAGKNPSRFAAGKVKQKGRIITDLRRPVEQVGFYDAVRYCNYKSKLEGFDTCFIISNIRDTVRYSDDYGELITARIRIMDIAMDSAANGFRLPTSDEHEYAQRAGSLTRYFWGDADPLAPAFSWYGDNSENQTHPVATRQPNGFGLYDMTGNVGEWCWGAARSYRYRSCRGGDYNSALPTLRSFYPHFKQENDGDPDVGFRLARNVP